MTKKSRLITGLLAAVLAAVMLSSAVYIAVEANHNCSGEDCAICHQLQVCENLLKSIGLAGAAAVFAAAVRYAPCRVIPSCAEVVRTFTLVSLKVKLSDYIRTIYKGVVYPFSDRLSRCCRHPCIFAPNFTFLS